MNLYLASTSPRRRELLRLLCLRFQLLTPSASEDPRELGHGPGDSPKRYAIACARAKALSVAERVTSGLVVGVDTVVVCGNEIMGKPTSRTDARRMLAKLSGRTHEVISGVAVLSLPGRKVVSAAEITRVSFRRLGKDEIERYVDTPEPYDKAGAYGIQEQAGVFVSKVSGCYLNVVGLPVPLLLELLTKSGWHPQT